MSTKIVGREMIRAGFVRALRTAFESNMDYQYKVHPNDPYQPADDTGIVVYDAWPMRRVSYPCIIVSLSGGDPMMRTMGDDYRSSDTFDIVGQDGLTYSNVEGETYGGGLHTDVVVSVYARSAIERSQIMDWVILYIRHIFIDLFRKEGVNIVSMSQSAENQTLMGNDPLYSDSVSVKVYTEFEKTNRVALSGTINAMSIISIFITSQDGTTYGS